MSSVSVGPPKTPVWILVAVLLGLGAPGCAPKSIVTDAGRIAYTADQVVARIVEVQTAVIKLQQAGQMPTATARQIVTFTVAALETIKATPDGWKPTVYAAWTQVRPRLVTDPVTASWVVAIDAVIGYVVGGGA
jgi:hypothetical protein